MKAALSSYSGETRFFLTNRDGNCIQSVSSSVQRSSAVSKNCELGTIKDVTVDGTRLLLSGDGDNVRYLDSATLAPVGNITATFRSTTPGLRKGDFFSHLTDVNSLAVSGGIVYGLSKDGLYVLLDADPTRGILLHPSHAPALKTNPNQSLSVVGDRIIISEPSRPDVVSLERLIPVSVEINVEKNTSESMASLIPSCTVLTSDAEGLGSVQVCFAQWHRGHLLKSDVYRSCSSIDSVGLGIPDGGCLVRAEFFSLPRRQVEILTAWRHTLHAAYSI
jgi:hypothetical protein